MNDREFGLLLLGVIGTVILVPALLMGAGMLGSGTVTGAQTWVESALHDWTPVVGVLIQLLFTAVVVGGGYLAVRAVVAGDRHHPPRQRTPATA